METRTNVVETFKRIFSHNGTFYSILLFVFSTVALTWFVDALGFWVQLLVHALLDLIGVRTIPIEYASRIGDAAIDLIGPSLMFGAALYFAFRNYKANMPRQKVHSTRKPEAHPGLIVMLSTYFHRQERSTDIGKLLAMMDSDTPFEEVRTFAFFSNWGPLVVALEHHKSQLEYCWIVATAEVDDRPGSADQFDAAKEVVQYFAGEDVHCVKGFPEKGIHPNNVRQVAHTVNAIYRDASTLNLKEEDIIADFTGGTAAMTAGMVLSTISERRKIQYLSQLNKLTLYDTHARDQRDLLKMEVLQEVYTSYEDVSIDYEKEQGPNT